MQTVANGKSSVPTGIVDSVIAAVANTHTSFFSERPSLAMRGFGDHSGPCIAGIISFVGNPTWTLSWIMTKEMAPALARRFAGFDIPFESADMGDLAGEVVNVLAGDIVAQLESRHIKAQMGLPVIARGSSLEFVPHDSQSIVHLEYTASEGPSWFRIEVKSFSGRIGGK